MGRRVLAEIEVGETPEARLSRELDGWLTRRNHGLMGSTEKNRKEGEPRPLPKEEAKALWAFIEAEVGEEALKEPFTNNTRRISLELMHSVFYRDMSIDTPQLVDRTFSTLAHFIIWKNSALGRSTRKLAQKVVDEWAADQYGAGVKVLVGKMRKGNLKATETLFKSIGKMDGVPMTLQTPIIQWPKMYVIANGSVQVGGVLEPAGKPEPKTPQPQLFPSQEVIP